MEREGWRGRKGRRGRKGGEGAGERVQSREAMGAMRRDGTMGHRTMEPWSAMWRNGQRGREGGEGGHALGPFEVS